MMNFCTLYDSNYISKGIALYLSIAKHTDDFTMYVMAMDRKCEETLTGIGFKNMVVECIEDNMTAELQKAKGNRSVAEYCWTCGSFVTDRFLHKYNLPDITYLDSDLMFFSSPQPIFDELYNKNASVGLSPHYVKYNASGKYCVQYVYFKNDDDGVSALRWWRDECLKWCYSKIEDGKYGDQMYLDYLPKRFRNVYDIDNKGQGMAAWNIFGREFHDGYFEEKGKKYQYIFFHYSGFNVSLVNGTVEVKANFELTDAMRQWFITPYAELLMEVFKNYLNKEVSGIRIYKGYGKKREYYLKLQSCLRRYGWVQWIISRLILMKYSSRHAPYSEHKK